jgi:hypothetical protein
MSFKILKQDRFLYHQRNYCLPSNTNKIPAEPRMSKLYIVPTPIGNLEDMTFSPILKRST